MFASGLKQYARLIVLFLASGCLFSAAAFSQNGSNQDPLSASPSAAATERPPVEQVLVPESVFAIRLAEALKLDTPKDAAQAEAQLSDLGIAPQNGWISDYPVTPAVLGDIEKGLAAAVEQGKLALGKEQALRVFGEVKTSLGLDVTLDTKKPAVQSRTRENRTVYRYIDDKGETHYTDVYDSIPEAYRNSVRILNPQAAPVLSGSIEDSTGEATDPAHVPPSDDIETYYDEQGPPVVTYYAPPASYTYLYTWMPYPFWSTGLYFPGFFVLNDFHRPVFLGHHRYFVRHHAHIGTGKYRHPFGKDSVKPLLRKSRQPSVQIAPSRRFVSPAARSGAQAIMSRSLQHLGHDRSSARSVTPRTQAARRPFAARESMPGNISNRQKEITWSATPKASRQSRAPIEIPWDHTPGISDRRASPRYRPVPVQRPSGEIGVNRPFFDQRIQNPHRHDSLPFPRQNRVFMPPPSFTPKYPRSFSHGGTFEGWQGGARFNSRGGGSFGNGARTGARR